MGRLSLGMIVRLLCLAVPTLATRLVTTTALPGVAPERAIRFLATPANWPKVVLSSWSVRGDSVEEPLGEGASVDEIFGLPPVLPLEVRWTCTSRDESSAVFDSPAGLTNVAKNCRMEFDAADDGVGGTSLTLVMSYDAVSTRIVTDLFGTFDVSLAELAAPILVVDNAIALKLLLPSKLSPLGASDPIAGPLVALARRTGVLPAEEADGWTGEPTAWAQSDSLPQRLSTITQRYLGGFKQWAAEAVAGEFDVAAADVTLDDAISGGGVTVFAFAACPFCKEAKALLDSKGAAYEWLLLDEREDGAALRARLGARTGRTSMPSVWVGGEYCGGLNDGLDDAACPGLAKLDERGALDARLRAAGAIPAIV